MIKNESSLNVFLILINIPLSAMESSQQSYNFKTYSGTDLHKFARQHSVLNLTARSRESFFKRMQELEIPFTIEDPEGKPEDLTDVTHKNKTCCIII